ncbi:MAG: DUF4062 domain-containing protein [Syntrophaceae bacterium]|nr:DUF4062 domain-containing protein [Syntrophaceae bacterium]
MTDLYKHYYVFISSPGDVAAERQFSEEVINNINLTCSDTLRVALEPRKWESLPPQTPHLPEEKIQDIINKEVEKAQFFVLILYKRYGHVEEGHLKSNTERELDTIMKRFETNPQIRILAYFREIPDNTDPGEQEQKVRDFRKRLENVGVFYRTYKTPEEFKDVFTHDMYNVLLRIRLSPFKQQMLRRFWKIGEPNRPTYPRLAILFPPVGRQFMHSTIDDVWLERLEPHVYFEDFKAIHKIMKLLSLIGFSDYKVYFNTDLPSDLKFMNRIWICFPRSHTAINTLDQLASKSRFRFQFRRDVSTELKWRSPAGLEFKVKSPLPVYLNEQRKGMDAAGEPTGRLRRIIAKDYGVIARFKNEQSADITEEGFLYDYYFAGIRGLGTWGTAWYIDRKAKLLQNHPEEGDIQLLLEVTYKNGGIVDVTDVSDRPVEYFEEQNNPIYIRERLLSTE